MLLKLLLTLGACFLFSATALAAPKAPWTQLSPPHPQYRDFSLSAPQLITQLKDKQHPRLILTEARLQEVKDKIASQDWAKQLHDEIYAEAVALTQKPVPPLNDRYWQDWKAFSDAEGNLMRLALMCRLHGEARFLERAKSELLALARLDSWKGQYLEMIGRGLVGMALGYDWLYNELSAEERQIIEAAGYKHGLVNTVQMLGEGDDVPLDADARWDNNWSQINYGGLIVASLAFAEAHPKVAARTITLSVRQLAAASGAHAPAGAGPEGAYYYDYGMQGQVKGMDALLTALGTDFGLSDLPEVKASALYSNAMRGPGGAAYIAGDGPDWEWRPIHLGWFAGRYPEFKGLLTTEQLLEKTEHPRTIWKLISPLALIWTPADALDQTMPASALFFGEETANLKPEDYARWVGSREQPVPQLAFRWSWNDPNTLWLATAAGLANANGHGQMDAGSFVFEAQGVRWVEQVAGHGYRAKSFSDYKIDEWDHGGGRWQVYAKSNKGKNTLMVDDDVHDPNGRTYVTQADGEPGPFAIALDMSQTLGPKVESAGRRFVSPDARTLQIEDFATAADAAIALTTRFHTRAKVETVDARTLLWRKNGQTLRVSLQGPEGAAFEVRAANENLNPWDMRLDEFTAVQVKVPVEARGSATIRLRFEVVAGG